MNLMLSDDIKLGENQVDRVYCGESIVWGLPKGYKPCKYLKNVGTIGIPLVVPSNNDIIVKLKMRNIKTTNRGLMGFSLNAGDYFGVDTNGRFELGGGVVIDSSLANPYDVNLVTVEFLENQRVTLSVNNQTISRQGTDREANILSLFYATANTAYLGKFEIYRTVIYYKGNIIKNLIPCLNLDNQPCFYDTVSKQDYLGRRYNDYDRFDYELK